MKVKRRPSQQPLFTHRNSALFWVGAIAAILILMLLMRQALNIMGSGGERWQQAELDSAINRFTHSVALAHAEWVRQGRADDVQLEVGEGLNQTRINIRMSAQGWPLPTAAGSMNDEQCMALWRELLVDLRLQLELSATWQASGEGNETARSIESGQKRWQGTCSFYNNQQLKFVYSLHNGRLRHVNMQN